VGKQYVCDPERKLAMAQDQPGAEVVAATFSGVAEASNIGFDWMFILLCTWLTGGIFLDGWAHAHGKVDQSFFTPWHAVLYSGYLAVAIFLAVTLARTHTKGAAWRHAYPAGYGSAIFGAAIFAVAGVGDLLWHTLFGIEKGIEGTISPSHLALALGGTLILTGPLRAAWRHTAPDAAQRWLTMLPPLLSLTYIFSLLVLFTQFADSIVMSRANLQVSSITLSITGQGATPENDLSTKLGVTGILLEAAIMTGVALVLVRRWRLPIGSFALIFGLNGLLVSFLAGNASAIGVTILSVLIGLLIDLMNITLRPSAERVALWRLFAFAVPFVYNLLYFGALLLTNGSFGWSVHLWTGSIVMAGIAGLLMSYLMVPPQMPTEAGG
jgi:hypothetical protein